MAGLRQFLRNEHFADIVERCTELDGLMIILQRRPGLIERLGQRASHIVHQRQVCDEARWCLVEIEQARCRIR